MAKKSREERAAEYHRVMAQIESSEAERTATPDEEGVTAYAARTFAQSIGLGLVFVALVIVPGVVGFVAGGTDGLWIGLAVGLVLAVAGWVATLVLGARGVGRALRR